MVTDDTDQGASLRSRIESAGERPVVLAGSEIFLIREGDDDTVDLVVTDLDAAIPEVRAVLVRLLQDRVFPGVPRLHLLRDPAVRDLLATIDPAAADAALEHPIRDRELRAGIRLAAEVGRLRRDRLQSSLRDPMTGIADRRYVLTRLDQEFSRARRYRSRLSLLAIDIDGLHVINRRHDASVGDRAIRAVADGLASQCRKEDLVGRTGEDEFAFVLPGTRYRGAAVLANKLRSESEALALEVGGQPVDVRISTGISSFPDNSTIASSEDLFNRAHAALAEAKARGGNRVYIDPGLIRRDMHLILIADPDPELLELAEDFLVMDDYRVVRAQTAEAALETFRFRTPDLVIVDLQMSGPDGAGRLIDAIRSRLGAGAC